MTVLVLDPNDPGDAGSKAGSIPRSQAYYWTPAWQEDEQAAVAELARGEGVRFSSGEDAAAWLLGDDDGEDPTAAVS